MTRKLRSSTGRGLSAAYAGEIIAFFACALYLVTGSVRPLVFGFVVAGFVGFASIVGLWRGQDEFGPVHRHLVRRATYLFFTASLFFLLAFLSFGTFTSPTTGLGLPGDNETASPTTPHRFKDLLPPLVLLGVALVTETLSGAHLLWELVGAARRRLVAVYGATGAAVALVMLAKGVLMVGDLRAAYGENAATMDLAEHYFDVFLGAVLPAFAGGFAATRLLALYLLRTARQKVAEAEADEPSAAASSQP